MKRVFWVTLLYVFGAVLGVSAQDANDFDTEYSTQDGGVTFFLPEDYSVTDLDDTQTLFTSPDFVFFGLVSSPDSMSAMRGIDEDSDLEQVADAFHSTLDADPDARQDFDTVELDSGLDAIVGILPFTNEDGEKGNYVSLIVEMDDAVYAGVLMVTYESVGEASDFIQLFGATLSVEESSGSTSFEGMPEITGVYFADDGISSDWEAAIEELEDLDLIDSGGELLFEEEMATEVLGGEGSADETYVNYVMGAVISVRELPDGTVGGCTFITRGVGSRSGIEAAVGVILTSEDEIFAIEQIEGQDQPRTDTVQFPFRGDLTFYNPQYVLVLVNDNAMTVWVNGDVYLDAWELEGDYPRDEYDDDVTTTVNPEPGCVMTGLWGYGF